jgi:hypothetical protein
MTKTKDLRLTKEETLINRSRGRLSKLQLPRRRISEVLTNFMNLQILPEEVRDSKSFKELVPMLRQSRDLVKLKSFLPKYKNPSTSPSQIQISKREVSTKTPRFTRRTHSRDIALFSSKSWIRCKKSLKWSVRL